MTPHALVMIAAIAASFTGRIALPHATLRIVAAVSLGLPALLDLFLREWPSPFGFLLVAIIAGVGAVIGIGAATVVRRWRG